MTSMRSRPDVSDRHMHITSFLYEQPEAIEEFMRVARSLPDGFFRDTEPVTVAATRGGAKQRTIAVAFFSKDDGFSDEWEMPRIAEALSGILEHDIEIVSAWEGGDSPGRRSTPRERVWLVRGSRSREPIP